MYVKDAILLISSLTDYSLDLLLSCGELVQYPKGHVLIEQGTVGHDIYILTEGIIRAYTTQKGEEVTFWIGEEGCIACSMRNYVEQQPGYETIELLEDCTLYRIRMGDLDQLYKENIEIANWGRKFIEKEVMKVENRLISHQFRTAKERYDELISKYPRLLQRVPLRIIASYLGITQVSLSRIRAQK